MTEPSSPSAVGPAMAPALYRLAMERLRVAAVRDLAWLLLSPNLLDARYFGAQLAEPLAQRADTVLAWLMTLDRVPAPLHAYLARHAPRRLGLYAERLLLYYLDTHASMRLIAANRQVRSGTRTLGECDCLLETLDGRRLHWELAVKYYLALEPSIAAAATPLAGYVGPNLADRLDLKLAHLLERQLPLSTREEFAALFPGASWQAQMLVRGWLFYRYGARQPAQGTSALEPGHLRGWWLEHDQWLAQQHAFGADAWAFLPRLSWLAPARLACPTQAGAQELPELPEMLEPREPQIKPPHGAVRIMAPAEFRPALVRRLERSESAAAAELVVALRRTADGYAEASRGFVVDAGWPARAMAFAARRD